jgi:hypothetical protein
MPFALAKSSSSPPGIAEKMAKPRTPLVPPKMNATTTHHKEIIIDRSSIWFTVGRWPRTSVFPAGYRTGQQ